MEDNDDTVMGLIPVQTKEGKDFLPFYMAYRTEMESKGIELRPSMSRYSRFWGEPRKDLAYWIVSDGERIGFLSIGSDDTRWTLEDLYVSREHRGKKIGKTSMERLSEIASYKGIATIDVALPRGAEGLSGYLLSMGFREKGDRFELDLLP